MELFRLLGTIAIDGSGANSAIDETTEKAEKSEGKISKAFEKIGSAAVKVGKVMATGLAVGTAAVTALAKSALDGYANYEQLVGGVETLFGAGGQSLEEYAESVGKSVDEVKDEYESMLRAQKTVLSNAEKAFQTAGMSTNEYMETVTSFSASLIQSLSGDTEAAAEKANQAIIDMSDNANKMGTNISMIQNAYQGFAKQNYTMLDNLKLGYGGTQEEMYRLMQDAAKLDSTFAENAVFSLDGKGSLDAKYSDIVDAIHIIQKEMGITNTTAKEASGTITGSASAMKASWSNLVAGFGNEDADLSGLVNQFTESALTVVDNVVPRIGVILGGITDALAQMMPVIAEKLPELVGTLLPSLIQAAIALMNGLIVALPTILQVLIEQLPFIMSQIGTALVTVFPVLLETVKSLFQQIWDYISLELLNTGISFDDAFGGIGETFNSAWEKMQQFWTEYGQPVWDNIKEAVSGAGEKFESFKEWCSEISDYLSVNMQPVLETLKEAWDNIKEALEPVTSAVKDAIDNFTEYNSSGELAEDSTNLLKDAIDLLTDAAQAVADAILAVSDWCVEHQSTIEDIAAIVGAFAAAWALVNGAIQLWNVIGVVATTVTGAFSAVVAFLTSPITLVVAAIGALIAIVVLLVKHWDEVSAAASAAWEWICGVFEDAADWFNENVVEPIAGFFSDVWENIKDGASEAWDNVKEAFGSVSSWFSDTFASAWQGVKDIFCKGGEIFDGITEGIGDFFKTTVNGIIGAINSIMSDAFGGINTALSKIKNIELFGAKPFDFISEISVPQIPLLEQGGVLEKGQVGLLEGNGAEAVVPLDQNEKWINKVAQDMNNATGNDALLQKILDVLLEIRDSVPEEFADIIAGMKFAIGEREFARLVKAVN